MIVTSRPTADALTLLGLAIRHARQTQRMTIAELAARIGVSSPTLIAIEKGSPRTAIGTVFEAAIVLGLPLFDDEAGRRLRERQALTPLLPRRVRRTVTEWSNAAQVPEVF